MTLVVVAAVPADSVTASMYFGTSGATFCAASHMRCSCEPIPPAVMASSAEVTARISESSVRLPADVRIPTNRRYIGNDAAETVPDPKTIRPPKTGRL